jgi:glycosyltransferase involved in cell wall biosynthesis
VAPKVAWLTGDLRLGEMGGAGYVRCALPAQALRAQGWDTGVFDLFNQVDGEIRPVDRWNREHDGFDTIVLQRWPFHRASDIVHKARAYGQRVLIDVDDWFYGVVPGNDAWAYWGQDEGRPGEGRIHYLRSMAAADGVICSTDYLAQRMAPRVPVPMVVAHNMCKLADWVQYPVRDQPPVIGWTGTTNFRSGDLEILRGVLGPFLEKHHLRFAHLGYMPGHPPIAPLVGIRPDQLETYPAVPLKDYHRDFRYFDVGLAPLADRPFNLAKSWLKPLEYACAGVPWLGSHVGEYREIPEGPRASSPRQWRKWLERLVDVDWRFEVRRWQRRWAETCDIGVAWKEWADALSSQF